MRIIQVSSAGVKSPFPVPSFVRDGERAFDRIEDFVRAFPNEWESGDVFVIDACYSWKGSLLTSFAGIRLLKLLRIYGFRQHCILYSFFSLHQILSLCPHSEILLSRGTTCVQLPGRIDEDLCREKSGCLCEEDVTAFFHLEALELMKTRRHSLANWWGVLRLYDVLQDFLGMLDNQLPEGLQNTLKRDSSYQGALMNHARFLGPPPPFFEDVQLESQMKEYMGALWERNLRVVYVDDEAETGWAYLLQHILYGKVRPDLFLAPGISSEGPNVESLANQVVSWKPDLLILDIRLSPEDETEPVSKLSGLTLLERLVSLEKGGRLVACPVLVFTASDKREVSEEALLRGADTVWTKEGVDEGERLSGVEYRVFSLTRFWELVKVLRRLTGPEYALLYGFLDKICCLKQEERTFWWEKSSWFPGDPKTHVPVSKEEFVRELERLFMTHKQLLSSARREVRDSLYELLMIRLGRLLEIIHPSRFEADKMLSLGKVAQEDWPVATKGFSYVSYLVFERNNFVHFDSLSEGHNMDYVRYGKNLSVFFEYLNMETERIGLVEKIKGTLESHKQGFILKEGFGSVFITCFDKGKTLTEGDTIEAEVEEISLRYPLKTVDISANTEADNQNWWTGSYRILRWGTWGVDIALSHISPRNGISFRLPFPETDVRPGMRIYFYINWQDDGGILKRCSVCRVSLLVPELAGLTYWSGQVKTVKATGDSIVRVTLEDITPPFAASFKVKPEYFIALQKDKGESQLCFLPQWMQVMTVKNPVLITGNNVNLQKDE